MCQKCQTHYFTFPVACPVYFPFIAYNCIAENVQITVGDNARMVGGLTGYAGGYEDETAGLAVTAVSRCAVNGVEISAGEGASAVGGVIGGGFRTSKDESPTVFTIADCTVSAAINGDEAPLTGSPQ